MKKIIDLILAYFKEEEVPVEVLEATYGKKNAQKIKDMQLNMAYTQSKG